ISSFRRIQFAIAAYQILRCATEAITWSAVIYNTDHILSDCTVHCTGRKPCTADCVTASTATRAATATTSADTDRWYLFHTNSAEYLVKTIDDTVDNGAKSVT